MPAQSRRQRNPLDGPWRPSVNVVMTAVVVLVAAAVIGGILLFSGDGNDEPGPTPEAAVSKTLIPDDAHTLTQAATDGPQVSLVEFLDYQCPACSSFYNNITSKIEKDYADRITFVPRNFPLDSHPLAQLAARSAEAAGKQDKFAEMYHQLYDNWDQWAVEGQSMRANIREATQQFEQYAADIGLDVEQFRADLDSDDVRMRVERDMADGEKLGVDSTPTFFINGEKFEPSGNNWADVERQMRDELDEALGG